MTHHSSPQEREGPLSMDAAAARLGISRRRLQEMVKDYPFYAAHPQKGWIMDSLHTGGAVGSIPTASTNRPAVFGPVKNVPLGSLEPMGSV